MGILHLLLVCRALDKKGPADRSRQANQERFAPQLSMQASKERQISWSQMFSGSNVSWKNDEILWGKSKYAKIPKSNTS